MRAAAVVLVVGLLLAPSVSLGLPSGKKWSLESCGTCASNKQCLSGRCVPVFKFANTVQNTGGTTVNGAQKLAYSTVVSRMAEAFKNWTSARVTTCQTSWSSVFGGSFSSPAGTAAVVGTDMTNNVIWLGGAYWRYSSATLALTTTTFTTSTGEIVDADMEINNNLDWSDTSAAGTYDVESTVLHEAGHFLGLDHTPGNALSVMYPTIAQGTTKRSLAPTDTTDLCTVYPGAAGSQGSICLTSTECTGGRVCEGADGASSKICTADCTGPTDTSCPTGYTCQGSSSGYACLTQLGSNDLCQFCTTGSDCATGVCVTDRKSLWCSASCSNDDQCGSGFKCDTSNFCVPNTSCTNQCTGSGQANCAVGFECVGGTCVPTGKLGDRCEVLGLCAACTTCVSDAVDTSIAYCRACCDGQASDGFCKGCAPATCDSSMACVGLANGKDKVCIPSSGAAVCQACGTGNPCQAGLTCMSGRCHSTCNPFAPGNCSACFDFGNGDGLCSCDDEVAHVAEPCGQSPTSLRACDNGLECVASPTPFCRVPCTLTDPNACRSGETCTPLSSKAVCLPSTAGNQCTACTSGGTCGNSQLSCYATRCYLTCNVNTSGRCANCVQIDGTGNGLCACPDQLVGPGENCGLPDIHFCQMGTLCVDSICRAECDPKLPISPCAIGSECKPYAGSNYCLPVTGGGAGGGTGGGASGGGSGGGGGFVGLKDGGTGGGGITQPTLCGCSSLGQAAVYAPLMLLAWVGRRKRRVTQT